MPTLPDGLHDGLHLSFGNMYDSHGRSHRELIGMLETLAQEQSLRHRFRNVSARNFLRRSRLGYQEDLAPFRRKTSLARTFWLRHKARPSARQRRFSQSTFLRRRLKNAPRVSRLAGAVCSNRWRKRRHQPSMAFRSGDDFGNPVSTCRPARFKDRRFSGLHRRHRSWS